MCPPTPAGACSTMCRPRGGVHPSASLCDANLYWGVQKAAVSDQASKRDSQYSSAFLSKIHKSCQGKSSPLFVSEKRVQGSLPAPASGSGPHGCSLAVEGSGPDWSVGCHLAGPCSRGNCRRSACLSGKMSSVVSVTLKLTASGRAQSSYGRSIVHFAQ